VEEAAAMRGTVSAATGRRYPLTMICAIFRVSHSTVYRTLAPASSAPPVAAKRGPKTRWSDAGGRRGNPHGAGGDSVPRRRLSEGPGSPGPSGPGHRRETRLALDARASAARTPAPRTAEWRPGARRDDHHDATGSDVGYRCDTVLHGGGVQGAVQRYLEKASPKRRMGFDLFPP